MTTINAGPAQITSAGEAVKSVWLLNVSVSVGGKTVTRRALTHTETGSRRERVERTDEVDTIILDRDQREDGQKLEAKLRGLARANGVCLDGYGYLTDSKGKDRFREDFLLTMQEVARHNAVPGQTAKVTARMVTLPIGVSFGADDTSAVLDFVTDTLNEGITLLQQGKLDDTQQWLQRAKHLGRALPALNANVVGDAIESARDARNAIAKRVRDLKLCVFTADGKPTTDIDPAHLRTALDCPEFDAAMGRFESALGWVSPSTAANLPTDIAA